jgi:hypothetical protein
MSSNLTGASMNLSIRIMTLPAALAAACLAAGCVGTGGTKSDSAAEAKPAPAAAAPSSKVGPGMNERGEVIDPKKVEAGYGQKVKGLEDWEGEITGRPAPGSRFGKLQIGMSAKQAMDLVGTTPTDQGAYITGKAFIPFFFGSDRYRYEVVYKGQGRLIFAGSSGFDGNSHLVWIIHSAAEQGYR